MAGVIQFNKYVSALPTTLAANSIYFVRVNNGFDIYVTNSTGTIVSYKSNATIAAEEAILLNFLGV